MSGREGSEAPEDGDGSKDEGLEEFRQEIQERGVEGDEETLEEWRDGLANKDDDVGTNEANDGAGSKDADGKDGPSEPKDQTKEGSGPDKPAPEEEQGKGGAKQDEPEKPGMETESIDGAGQDKSQETGDDADKDGAEQGPREELVEGDSKDGSGKAKAPEPEAAERALGPEGRAQTQDETGKAIEPELERPAQVEAESYIVNDNQLLVTEQASPPDREEQAETPGLHRLQEGIQREREEEPRLLEAVDYGKGANLRVPMGDLEQAGYEPPGQNAIVQLGLRPEGSEEVQIVFARYSARDHRAEAYVGDIGGGKGNRYEAVEAKGVNEDALVRAFEREKCDHLDNVKLEHGGDRMLLNVDGRGVELEGYKMATSGSHVVLRGKLEGRDNCKVEFDGHRASMKFGRDYPVEGMRMEKDELAVKYEQSRNEVHEHRIHLEHLATPERPSLNQFDKPQMMEHLQVLNRPPGNEGMYQVALDKPAQDEVRSLLTDAPDYRFMKAEISERLVPNVLESLGWERVERHPFSRVRKDNAAANGADWLMRDPDENMVLVEVKWFENRRNGIKKAASQVEKDFRDYNEDPDLDLKAAYIAIVEYDEENRENKPMKVHVLRIMAKEELR